MAKTDKILITVPFWKGDKMQAMTLARLLADITPTHSDRFDFAFVARYDCKHDKDAGLYVSKKFNTFNVTAPASMTGWPHGCNATFHGTIDWFLRGALACKIPGYKAIFVCEGDATPLTTNSLNYLHEEWDRLQKAAPTFIAGALIPAGPHGHAHINGGCCLLSGDTDFLYWLTKRVGNSRKDGVGWDWGIAHEFSMKGWADMPGIKSYWRRPTFDPAEWDGLAASGMQWLHGVKDLSMLMEARKRLTHQ